MQLTPEEQTRLRALLAMEPATVAKASRVLAALADDPEELAQIMSGLGEISRHSEGLLALSRHSAPLVRAMEREARWRAVTRDVATAAAGAASFVTHATTLLVALAFLGWLLLSVAGPGRWPEPPPLWPSQPHR